MNFPGHSRSLHLLRSSSDESLATFQNAEADENDQRFSSPQTNTTSSTEKAAPWFASKASGKDPRKTEPSRRNEWPNGPPPSGPRSQRIAISPPAIRRSSNENDHVRRISDHGTTASFTRQSFPSSVQWRRTDTLPASSRDVELGKELRADDIIFTSGTSGKTALDGNLVATPDVLESTYRSSESDWHATARLSEDALWTAQLDNNESPVHERASKEQPDGFLMHLDVAETSQPERFHRVTSPTHLIPPQPKQQSSHPDETASVVSDLTMSSGAAVSGRSSMTSGSRTRTCHKCKRAAQGVCSLFKCSQCPRRYHTHCATPKIPSNSQL